MNLEYGSHAPGAPQVFIGDQDLPALWAKPERHYLLIYASETPRFKALLANQQMYVVKAAGGKLLLTNQPLATTSILAVIQQPPGA